MGNLTPLNLYEQTQVRDAKGKIRTANVIPGAREALPMETGELAFSVLTAYEAAPSLIRGGFSLLNNGPSLLKGALGLIDDAKQAIINTVRGNRLNKTGTVWDAIHPVGPMHPGSVIPQKFELSLESGGRIWVDSNATKHIAEYTAVKAMNSTPEAVRLLSQV